jgi:hypothetical protein
MSGDGTRASSAAATYETNRHTSAVHLDPMWRARSTPDRSNGPIFPVWTANPSDPVVRVLLDGLLHSRCDAQRKSTVTSTTVLPPYRDRPFIHTYENYTERGRGRPRPGPTFSRSCQNHARITHVVAQFDQSDEGLPIKTHSRRASRRHGSWRVALWTRAFQTMWPFQIAHSRRNDHQDVFARYRSLMNGCLLWSG